MVRLKSIVASKDDLLDALFDRTYAHLSEAGKRIFLTLCSWNSYIPELALEAVILKNSEEFIDVKKATDELINCSFVERYAFEKEEYSFVKAPLTALIFGKKKIAVSSYKINIDSDMQILQLFGATQESDIQHGIALKINILIQKITNLVQNNKIEKSTLLPMLEFIAKRYQPAWMLISQAMINIDHDYGLAKQYIKRFIENATNHDDIRYAWSKLYSICKLDSDYEGILQSAFALAEIHGAGIEEISEAANRINNLLYQRLVVIDTEKKSHIISRLAELMEKNLEKANADDCSRLAWLYLHMQRTDKALEICARGLELDDSNEHCLRLHARLTA